MNNRITKFLAITLFLLNISLVAKGEAVDVVTGATPVKLKIEANVDKQLVLDVSYEENSVIREAPLGLNVDHRLLGKDAQQLSKEKKENNTLVYEFQQVDGSRFFLDARIFPDGIALRYRVPADGPVCIYGEETSFIFPSQTKAWYASGPFQYGWLQEYQERETDHVEGELLAPPATFRLPNGIYAAITEANLFNYHGAVLLGTAPNCVRFGYVENKGHMETGIVTGLPPRNTGMKKCVIYRGSCLRKRGAGKLLLPGVSLCWQKI